MNLVFEAVVVVVVVLVENNCACENVNINMA